MQLQPIASKLERLADVLETREQIVAKLDHLTSDMQDVSSRNQDMTVENSKLKSELGTSHQQVGGIFVRSPHESLACMMVMLACLPWQRRNAKTAAQPA